MTADERLKYLEKKYKALEKKVDIETKYRKSFEKYANYQGNGVYQWSGVFARDTRVLFIKVVLLMEKVKFDNTYDD